MAVNQIVHFARNFKQSFHFSGKTDWAILRSAIVCILLELVNSRKGIY